MLREKGTPVQAPTVKTEYSAPVAHALTGPAAERGMREYVEDLARRRQAARGTPKDVEVQHAKK